MFPHGIRGKLLFGLDLQPEISSLSFVGMWRSVFWYRSIHSHQRGKFTDKPSLHNSAILL